MSPGSMKGSRSDGGLQEQQRSPRVPEVSRDTFISLQRSKDHQIDSE